MLPSNSNDLVALGGEETCLRMVTVALPGGGVT
jgi:hypothetical protein